MPDQTAPMTEAHYAEQAKLEARYGSLEAIVALQPDEAAMQAAVQPWCEFRHPPNGPAWVVSIDGAEKFEGITPRARDALSAALPMPTTIPEALAEHERWKARDWECRLAFETPDRRQLDLPAVFRWNLVMDLLEYTLQARTIADVGLRQRYLVGLGGRAVAVARTILADLERLEVREIARLERGQGEAPVEAAHTGQMAAASEWTSATDRRQRVIGLLSNVDTARLPDREIARRAGVSPQTVGNLRRRMAGEQQGEMFAA